MEYYDILNKDGSLSGRIAPKGQEVGKDEYYLGVHAYIHNSKGEYLLQQRAFDKEFLPGGWDIHMGHVMAGETSREGIIREIYEELGVNIDKINFVKRILWEKYNHFIDIYVVCEDLVLEKLVLQKSEVVGVKYVSKNEMLELIRNMDYRPEEYRTVVEKYVNGTK